MTPRTGHPTPPAAANRRSFDRLPAVFDRFAQLHGQQINAYLTARLPPPGTRRALDLGCGTGRLTHRLAATFDQVLGVDICEPMLRYAQHHHPATNLDYACRDLREVTADRDGTFDFILCAYVLHHVPDLPAVLTQIRSLVAAPCGQLVLIDAVDERGRVPRAWLRAEARRALIADLRGHRRPVPDAVAAYRVAVSKPLLDHFSTDDFLTPTQFRDIYTAVFPNAAITSMYRSRALSWTHQP